MLVGRGEHLGRLFELVSAARAGGGGAAVLRGEAGVGKTALLDAVASRAAEVDATVLRARGMEAESGLAFATLHDLCRPILEHLDELPTHQREVLAGALALGPPVGGDRFSVSVAVLSMFTRAAERAPVVAIVDDIHWIDVPTAETLVFLARRAAAEGIAVVLGWRDTEPLSVELGGISEMIVEPLDPDDSRALVFDLCGRGLHPETVTRLLLAGAGNPLALRELAQLHRRGMLRLPPGGAPPPAGITVGEVYARRARALPPRSRQALTVASVSSLGLIREIEAALAAHGLRVEDLLAAVSDGLATIEAGRFLFVHPLARAAIYHTAGLEERQSAHLAMAAAIGTDRAQERRAWHLAAATTLPDEAVARELESAGRDARMRGGPAAAAQTFEEAARLSESPGTAAPRFVLAAEAWQAVGRGEAAVDLADRAIAAGTDPNVRARAHRARARALARTGRRGVIDTLMEEAGRVADTSPELAAAMYIDAAVAALSRVHGPRSLDAAEHAARLATAVGGRLADMAAITLGAAYVLDGRIDEGLALVRRYPTLLEHGIEDEDGLGLLDVTAMALVWAEKFDECRVLLERAVSAARKHSLLGTLPNLLLTVALLEFGPGDWTVARAALEEVAQLGEQTGQGGMVAAALTRLALMEAFQGHEEACRACVDRVRGALGREPARSAQATLASAIAQLDLTFGRPEAAVAALEPFVSGDDRANPAAGGWWETYLVEAYFRTGRPREAANLLDRFETRARASGNRRAIAHALRCRGMLADDVDEAERCFAEAAALVERPCVHWPWATTHLLWGMRLRDAGRAEDADRHLETARATFELLESRPLAEQAQAALSTAHPSGPVQLPLAGPSVRVLGRIAARSGDIERPLVGHPARAVAFVALHGRPAHTDELVEALWPGTEPGRGRVRLRNVLSRLRRDAGDVVARRGDLVELAAGVDVDAWRFEYDVDEILSSPDDADPVALLERGSDVANRYHGGLAPELLYEPWCDAVRPGFERRYVRLLERLAHCAAQLGEDARAEAFLDRAEAVERDADFVDLRSEPSLERVRR